VQFPELPSFVFKQQHVKTIFIFIIGKNNFFTAPTDEHIMMLSTKKTDRFVINGATTKLTLFIKNLIQAVESKITNDKE
jgi:hypothetical protein